MNETSAPLLDADELLHLAIAASDRDQTDQAIALLKRAIEADPGNAKAYHLLGAEHAQIGMFERAIEDMRRALELDAGQSAARFQLGLLLLTSRQPQAAEEVWRGLEPLGADHFYVLFKTGLLHLARDEFAQCVRCLQAGIAANTALAPLNVDMQRILDQAQALMAGQAGADATAPGDEPAANHLLLNAYSGQR